MSKVLKRGEVATDPFRLCVGVKEGNLWIERLISRKRTPCGLAQVQASACSEVYEAFGLWQGPRCIFRELTGHFAGSQRVTILTEPHGRWLRQT